MSVGGGVLEVAKRSGKVECRTTPVEIDTRLARKARTIAEDKGISVTNYLSGINQGHVERDWTKILKKIAQFEEGN
jgi:hypothetical protein